MWSKNLLWLLAAAPLMGADYRPLSIAETSRLIQATPVGADLRISGRRLTADSIALIEKALVRGINVSLEACDIPGNLDLGADFALDRQDVQIGNESNQTRLLPTYTYEMRVVKGSLTVTRCTIGE